MVEVIFDTMLEDYFGTNSGNCYKPENDGAQFAQSIFNLDDFELKTNEVGGDKSDIQELFNILHSADRTSNPEAWKTSLESVFDVNGFLKYLAANNTIQNWDTYGIMPHNYYLYHDPQDGLIKWIVWDNNEAFQNGKQGGAVSLAMSEVGTDWPLIPYIIGDSEYEATYKSYLQQFITTSFESSRVQNLYSTYESLIYASAEKEQTGYSYINGISGFTSAMSSMKSHNTSRIATVNAYLQ
jgi:spore coat protein CotH